MVVYSDDSDISEDDKPLFARVVRPKAAVGGAPPPLKSRSEDLSSEGDVSSSDDDQPLFSTSAKKSKAETKGRFFDSSDSDEVVRVPRAPSRPNNGVASSTYNGARKRKARDPPMTSGKRARTEARSHTPRRTTTRTPSSPRSNREAGTLNNPIDPNKYPQKEEVTALQSDKNAQRWWEKEPYKGDTKWTTLDHNGVVFPPPYQPHGVKPLYDGAPLDLTPEQEELATFYAQMIETDWVKKKVFNKNFFFEFRRSLVHPKAKIKHPECTHFNKFNFRPIFEWSIKKKEADKLMKKEKAYREKLKEERKASDEVYGYAIVDGIREKVGNYKVEPPGLFRGRGDHPKAGQLKKRLVPEQVTINIGKGTPIPPCPVPGHSWGGVIHDRTVTYIAKWVENINGQHKFVYLHASSRFKGQADMAKYEKARELKKHIGRIRADYERKLKSSSLATQQLATCVWIIDRLAIRIGNEKDTDEEADTVGVCSFRVEHLTDFKKNEEGYWVTLDFLGKDSMRYQNTVKLPKIVWNNMKSYHNKRGADQPIFEKVDPSMVNEYLKELMPGLSAKVFRTYNASITLQQELGKTKGFQFADRKADLTTESPEHEKRYFYDTCNKQVAILCNHKKTVNKAVFEKSEKSINEKIKKAEDGVKELKRRLKIAKGQIRPKADERKWANKDPSAIQRQLDKKKTQFDKLKMDKQLKHDNKEVALGTSKINYMDPRITVAFAKRMELAIEKVFNRALLDKFPWAMAAEMDYVF